MGSGVHVMLNILEDDVIYDTLPLYHTAGGMVGIGQAVLFGNTLIIRRKFSASNFWKDCVQYKATVSFPSSKDPRPKCVLEIIFLKIYLDPEVNPKQPKVIVV